MGEKKFIACTVRVDDPVYDQIVAIAEKHEWTLTHVLRKLLPLGLAAYLADQES